MEKACDFGGSYFIGGNYNWNVINGEKVSQTLSVGLFGVFGGTVTWDKNGIINRFVGLDIGGKIAFGWGASGSVRLGFTW